MLDEKIDTQGLEELGEFSKIDYTYKYLYFDSYNKKFVVDEFHCGYLDCEEFYDGRKIISTEEVLELAFPDLKIIHKKLQKAEGHFEKLLKTLMENRKSENNIRYGSQYKGEDLDAPLYDEKSDSLYYKIDDIICKCAKGEFYKWNITENRWEQDDNVVFEILKRESFQVYSAKYFAELYEEPKGDSGMRNLDKLANEKFNGDMEKTLRYLIFNEDGVNGGDYIDEMTQQEAMRTLEIMKETVVKGFGCKRNYNKVKNIEEQLEKFNLTREEVINAEKNPYKGKMVKSIIGILVLQVVMGIMSGIGSLDLGIFWSILTGIVTLDVVRRIKDYVDFKKLKKAILDEPTFNKNLVTHEDKFGK